MHSIESKDSLAFVLEEETVSGDLTPNFLKDCE